MVKIRNATPLILSVLLVLLICVVLLVRLSRESVWRDTGLNFDIIFAALYLFWILIESRVSKKELDKGAQTFDYGTCELYAIGQAAVFLSALWFDPIWRSPHSMHLFGGVVFLGGILFRLWAIQTLGKYYSHIVRQVGGHKIIHTGPYAYIRHPAYAGMLVGNLGIVLYFFNYVTLGLFAFLLVPAIVLRIRVEEKMLFQLDEYAEYARLRKRIVPLIW